MVSYSETCHALRGEGSYSAEKWGGTPRGMLQMNLLFVFG